MYPHMVDIHDAEVIAKQWVKEVGACETTLSKIRLSFGELYRKDKKIYQSFLMSHLYSFHPQKGARHAYLRVAT